MKLRQHHRPTVWIIATLVLMSSISAGCATPAPGTPRLRITNGGAVTIENLTILFPDDRVEFGDVAPGQTTDYEDVPNGVYSYAAYELEIGGQMVTQPVIDWVGEEPLDGMAFTYTLEIDPGRPLLQSVQLVEVTTDE
jgi:hypothetical protein